MEGTQRGSKGGEDNGVGNLHDVYNAVRDDGAGDSCGHDDRHGLPEFDGLQRGRGWRARDTRGAEGRVRTQSVFHSHHSNLKEGTMPWGMHTKDTPGKGRILI